MHKVMYIIAVPFPRIIVLLQSSNSIGEIDP